MWWLIACILLGTGFSSSSPFPTAIPVNIPVEALDVEAIYPAEVLLGPDEDISWTRYEEMVKDYSVLMFIVVSFMPIAFLSIFAFHHRM
jgi:hypothetical protein